MTAQLITRFKNVNPDGSILELVVWKLDTPVPPTEHGYKYRAVYVLNDQRIVGFDNERGKGDHCHLDGKEVPYTFISVAQLVEDFIEAVATRRAT
jgi:hypothetical protein